ncbi:MAG: hypothetical protein GX549_01940 [Clostridiales bacterium]|nr:hypothetical protein [Clostridiales bacterium]
MVMRMPAAPRECPWSPDGEGLAAALARGLRQAGDDIRVVTGRGPAAGALAAALEKEACGAQALRFVCEGLPPRYWPGWAAGLALCGETVWCVCEVGTALSGPALEAARWAGGRKLAGLTLIVWGAPPAACDPAALYAALGWKAIEIAAGNGAGIAATLASRSGTPLPVAVFIKNSEAVR